MSYSIKIVGIGPGDPQQCTPQAHFALEKATDFIGYTPYLKRLTLNPKALRHGSDNRYELNRGELAIKLAQKGREVVIISGGDPGIFGMASALFEVIAKQPLHIRKKLNIEIIPGISAILACAAKIGAPIGGDFCVISLSDNLKPWNVIIKRLRLAAQAGFIIALYNPRSYARPWQLGDALKEIKKQIGGNIPIAFIKAAGRSHEEIHITTLNHADPTYADMRTLILIGNQYSQLISHGKTQKPWFYTPRKIEK